MRELKRTLEEGGKGWRRDEDLGDMGKASTGRKSFKGRRRRFKGKEEKV